MNHSYIVAVDHIEFYQSGKTAVGAVASHLVLTRDARTALVMRGDRLHLALEHIAECKPWAVVTLIPYGGSL